MQPKPDPSALLLKAGDDMIARADDADTSMVPVFLEMGKLLKIAAESIAAHALDASVLRIELASANDRANRAAENARAWFERHEDLVKAIADAKKAA